MQATIQAKTTKFSTASSERHTPSRLRQTATDGVARPSLLKRFLAALVAALAVPTI